MYKHVCQEIFFKLESFVTGLPAPQNHIPFWMIWSDEIPLFLPDLILEDNNWFWHGPDKGRHGLAFSLAFIELLFHQVAAVYYIGWDSGLQYFLIYLAGLTFFLRTNSGTVLHKCIKIRSA